MCSSTNGNFYEPPDFERCDAVAEAEEVVVMERLEKTEWDAECDALLNGSRAARESILQDAIARVHPPQEGDKYDDHPDV